MKQRVQSTERTGEIKKPMDEIVFDIEANGYLYEADRVWCIVSKDLQTREVVRSHTEKDIRKHIELLNSYNSVIGHNILGYDLPLLSKLYPDLVQISIPEQVQDTFVMSALFKPDRIGGHSLESWGARLHYPKTEFDAFGKFSADMLKYCENDVEVNARLYEFLQREKSLWDWDESLKLEYRLAYIQANQELNGVGFDEEEAINLFEEIQREIDEIDAKLYAELPLRPVMFGTEVSRPFLKTGGYSKAVRDWYE